MDTVVVAADDYLFQIFPVLLLILKRPATAPGNPDPVELRLVKQSEHLLELSVVDVGQYIVFFGGELRAPPRPLCLPALDSPTIQAYETKIPLLGPRRHGLQFGAIQFRRRLKGLGRVAQQRAGHQANQSDGTYDSDPLRGFLPSKDQDYYSDYWYLCLLVNLFMTNSWARPRATWSPMLVPKFVNTSPGPRCESG